MTSFADILGNKSTKIYAYLWLYVIIIQIAYFQLSYKKDEFLNAFELIVFI